MVGNPSITAWLRARRKNSSLSQPAAKRRVVNVDWGQVQAAASAFAARNCVTYDLVVGLQPDGVSLANILAGRLQSRYAAIDKQYPQAKRTPFFVFESDGHSRSVRASVTDLTVPRDIVNPSRILVVDGVTTFGNALAKAEKVVLRRFKNAQIDFYVFAIDQPRLAAAHPELVDRVAFHTSIDNYMIWLHFPWDPF
jgi:hypothetical protein